MKKRFLVAVTLVLSLTMSVQAQTRNFDLVNAKKAEIIAMAKDLASKNIDLGGPETNKSEREKICPGLDCSGQMSWFRIGTAVPFNRNMCPLETRNLAQIWGRKFLEQMKPLSAASTAGKKVTLLELDSAAESLVELYGLTFKAGTVEMNEFFKNFENPFLKKVHAASESLEKMKRSVTPIVTAKADLMKELKAFTASADSKTWEDFETKCANHQDKSVRGAMAQAIKAHKKSLKSPAPATVPTDLSGLLKLAEKLANTEGLASKQSTVEACRNGLRGLTTLAGADEQKRNKAVDSMSGLLTAKRAFESVKNELNDAHGKSSQDFISAMQSVYAFYQDGYDKYQKKGELAVFLSSGKYDASKGDQVLALLEDAHKKALVRDPRSRAPEVEAWKAYALVRGFTATSMQGKLIESRLNELATPLHPPAPKPVPSGGINSTPTTGTTAVAQRAPAISHDYQPWYCTQQSLTRGKWLHNNGGGDAATMTPTERRNLSIQMRVIAESQRQIGAAGTSGAISGPSVIKKKP